MIGIATYWPILTWRSWQTELQQALTQATPPDRGIRVAVVGVGHELRGDDAVGLAVAQRMLARRRPGQSLGRESLQEVVKPAAGRATDRISAGSEPCTFGTGTRSEAGSTAVLDWLVLVGGSAPENCTGTLRRFGPDFVVLVDAADLHARPGSIHWLECAQIGGLSATTHTLPLSVVAAYLTAELRCTVGVLAIQSAASNDIGAPLSPEVNRAARQLARVLSALSL